MIGRFLATNCTEPRTSRQQNGLALAVAVTFMPNLWMTKVLLPAMPLRSNYGVLKFLIL